MPVKNIFIPWLRHSDRQRLDHFFMGVMPRIVVFLRLFKPFLANTLYSPGKVRTIIWGPCRGLRYRIFPEYGLAPLYGGWEPRAQRLMTEHVLPGWITYDIGANYGVHTLLMARLVGKSGHVFAFEPVPEILSSLRENIAMNSFSNVTCIECAADNRTRSHPFLRRHHAGAGALAGEDESVRDGLIVKTITLDDFVFERNNRPPNFIKIDVEGAEGRVLCGAERILRMFRPILLIDLHTPDQDLAVGQILAEYRYDAYRVENGARVKFLRKGWPDLDGIWGQILAIPEK